MNVMSQLIKRFIEILASIPPSEEYISQQSRCWFRVHMAFGVLGPTLVIFHSNYELGSFNSRVALFR